MPCTRTLMGRIRNAIRSCCRESYCERVLRHSLDLDAAPVHSYHLRAEVLGLHWLWPDGITDNVLDASVFEWNERDAADLKVRGVCCGGRAAEPIWPRPTAECRGRGHSLHSSVWPVPRFGRWHPRVLGEAAGR